MKVKIMTIEEIENIVDFTFQKIMCENCDLDEDQAHYVLQLFVENLKNAK